VDWEGCAEGAYESVGDWATRVAPPPGKGLNQCDSAANMTLRTEMTVYEIVFLAMTFGGSAVTQGEML
jgi:hypothetical protein